MSVATVAVVKMVPLSVVECEVVCCDYRGCTSPVFGNIFTPSVLLLSVVEIVGCDGMF